MTKDQQKPTGNYLGVALDQALPTVPASAPPPPHLKKGRKRDDIAKEQLTDTALTEEREKAGPQDSDKQEELLATLQNENVASSSDSEPANQQEKEKDIVQRTNVANKEERKIINIEEREAANQQVAGPDTSQRSETVTAQESNKQTAQLPGLENLQANEIMTALHSLILREQKKQEAKQQKEQPADMLIRLLANVDDSYPDIQEYRTTANIEQRNKNQGVTAPGALFTIYKAVATRLSGYGEKASSADLMTRVLINGLITEVLPHLQEVRAARQQQH